MKTLLDLFRGNCILIENSGTGFWITPHHAITCGHVLHQIGQKTHWNATQLSGKGQRTFELKLVKDFSPATDIAILECTETLDNEIIPLASYCNLGQSLLGFAFQPGEKYGRQFLLQYIARAFWDNHSEILVLEGNIFPGYSGAPIYNPVTNAICGILWGRRNDNSENYALSVSIIENCIREVLPDFQTKAITNEAAAQKPKEDTPLVQETNKADLEKAISSAEKLLGEGELEACADVLHKLTIPQSVKNDLLTIRAKISSLERNRNLGLMNFENLRVEENSIIQFLLMVINSIRSL